MRHLHSSQSVTFSRRALFSLLPLAALTACAEDEEGQDTDTPTTPEPATTVPAPPAQIPALQKLLNERVNNKYSVLVAHTNLETEVHAYKPEEAKAPASCFKILTYLALAHSIELDTRFKTMVARSGNDLTLVAGGDTMLSTGDSKPDEVNGRAGLASLAKSAVEKMKEDKTDKGKFPVFLDSTLYKGDGLNSGWEKGDIDSGQITGIWPIALESHAVPGTSQADGNPTRPANAGTEAHKAFVDALNKAGEPHGYSFETKEQRQKPEDANIIATVESATVLEQARHMMLESDNALAESLARNAAISRGQDGSAEQAQKLVRQMLEENGVSTEGLVQADVCGLSLQNRVGARTLVQALAKLLEHPRQRELLDGFPVAGKTGTLKNRFSDPDSEKAREHVRAKTGTLYTVTSLAGYTTHPDGTRLIFALLISDLDINTVQETKKTVDTAAAIIAGRSPLVEQSAPASESASESPQDEKDKEK